MPAHEVKAGPQLAFSTSSHLEENVSRGWAEDAPMMPKTSPNLPGFKLKIWMLQFSNRQPPTTSTNPAYMVQPIPTLRRGIINLRGQIFPTNQELP